MAPVTPERSLLVIEDDDDVRELLLSHVRGLGWTAGGAASGSAGFALALADPPTAVVVDILLPDLDGRQVVRGLRGDPRTAGCLVVLNSVLDLEDYLHTIVDLSIDAILPKPFSRADVVLLMRMLEQQHGSSVDVDTAPRGETA
jgi:DNA-binding response OmpR family regulator